MPKFLYLFVLSYVLPIFHVRFCFMSSRMLEPLNELASLGTLTVRDPFCIWHSVKTKMDPGLLAALASGMTRNKIALASGMTRNKIALASGMTRNKIALASGLHPCFWDE